MPETSSKLTVFTTCKPFTGDTGKMQRAAISSWHSLGLDIIIIGDETGSQELCQTLELQHIPLVARNQRGTPLLSDLFKVARKNTDTPYLVYINADIFLDGNFVTAFENLFNLTASEEKLLLTARRINFPFINETELMLSRPDGLAMISRTYGSYDYDNAVDLFLFSRELFQQIPELAIGRMQWDNWLLWQARQQNAMVIDGSYDITLLHPIHGYASHCGGWFDVTQGEEAQQNRAAAQGNAMTLAQACTHILKNGQLLRVSDQVLKKKDRDFASDPERELSGGLHYLLGGFDKRPLSQTIDTCKTLLWRNQHYFPFRLDSMISTEDVYSNLLAASKLIDAKQFQAACESIEDILTRELIERLKKLQTEQRPLLLWGAGGLGQRALSLLQRHNIEIAGFIDRDPAKQANGVAVFPTDWQTIYQHFDNDPFVLITSMYFKDIASELTRHGLSAEKDYVY